MSTPIKTRKCVVTEDFLVRMDMALKGKADETEIKNLKTRLYYYITKSKNETRERIVFYNPKPERKKEEEMEEKLSVKETAIKLRGTAIVQLDYETGEYIDEYPSISTFAEDNYIAPEVVSGSLNKNKCAICYIHYKKLMFMRKETFTALRKSLEVLDNE